MLSIKNWLRRFICLIAGVISTCLTIAQTADFKASPTSGCSPLPVMFTNTSTGFSDNATYTWDFGNGNTSALKDSTGAQYKDERAYTVTLTVNDNGKTYTKSITVTVYKKPVVNFSVNTENGCAPLPVTFTSSATPGDGTIASYFWDFGDGATSAGAQQVEHTYRSAATISPSLTVTNSYGCYSTFGKANLIKVLPSVNPNFEALNTILCNVTDTATFINKSTGEGTLSYNWDFGDGTTSTVENPKHRYKSKGTYDIKLQVTNSNGCTLDTLIPAYINAANFNTDFEVPSSLCESANISFTDISSPKPSSFAQQQWMVDGKIYHADSGNLSHSFTSGPHTIQLIDEFGNCKDTATKRITIMEKPKTTGFVADIQNNCGAPATVQFKDTTAGAVKWEWDVANTTNSNFVPSEFTSSTSYTYNSDGTYYVWLRTTNATGCTAEVVQPIDIQKVSALIHSSAGAHGCDQLATTLSATSSQVIKTLVWDFGDGTPNSTDKTPVHKYDKPGNYPVTLSFTTANGCQGTASYNITVTPTPKFDFTALPGTTICGNNPVSFEVSGSNIDGSYFWNFGDSPDYHQDSMNTSHQYQYDTTFSVSLVITKDGCSDTVTKPNYITVLPPFPKIYSQANTCEGTRGLLTFRDSSRKATEWIWDFGDNSPAYSYTSPQENIQHTYSKTGSYTVILTTKNGNCTAMDSIVTFVLLKQSPLLSSPLKELCGSDHLPVSVSGVETNPAAVYDGSFHDFDVYNAQYRDSSLFTGNYTSPDDIWRGTFHLDLAGLDNLKSDLRVVTTSFYFNCLDTTNYIPLKIKGPKAGFKAESNNCFKEPITFTDTSKGSAEAAIVKWEWNFGDGNTAVKINKNAFSYQYPDPATYKVLLTVTDNTGCTDTVQEEIPVNGPKAAFDISDNPVVPASDVHFYNRSIINEANNPNENQFTWVFGDGTQLKDVSLDSSPVHNYARTGVDTVMLIAKNTATQCTDTAIQYLYVKNLNLDFTYTTEFINPGSGCPPVLATFNSATVNTTSISWNFGDGTTAGNIEMATHTYNKPGKYKVTLYGNFTDGTQDSVFQYITIKGPYATLKADRQFVCGAQPIKLSANASQAISYIWDFGDGTLTDAADTFAVHKYITPGVYTPSLIVKDSNSCSFPFFLNKPIIIDTLHLAIHTRPAIVCDSSVVLFTPEIVSVAKDEVKVPLQYHWDFGTDDAKDTANIESPAFIYNHAGTYQVSFSASSPYGCAEQTSAPIVVNPTPIVGIEGPSVLCQDGFGNFIGTSNMPADSLTWEWRFPNGGTSGEQKPVQQQFTQPGNDSVILIVNAAGCQDTAYSMLTVFAKPVVNLQPVLPQICAGQTVQLEAHDGIDYKWSPTEGVNNTGIANPIVTPNTTTLYKVVVKNDAGCISSDSVMVRVIQPFKVVTPPLLNVCRGSLAQLNASGADLYRWIEGSDLNNPDIANPTANTTTSQIYKVVGYDSSHCFTDTAITEVRIAELPTVKVGNDINTFAGSPVTLTANASNDVVNWRWLPDTYLNCTDCPAPVSTPQANIVYVVQVNNAYGCIAKDSLQINVMCKQSLVQIPSAFTPNGDGKNERFNIKGNGIKQINRFAVFNRDGQMLFERTNMSANDYNAGWDGTFGGKAMAPGTYVYLAEIVCATGEIYQYKGTVVLIR